MYTGKCDHSKANAGYKELKDLQIGQEILNTDWMTRNTSSAVEFGKCSIFAVCFLLSQVSSVNLHAVLQSCHT